MNDTLARLGCLCAAALAACSGATGAGGGSPAGCFLGDPGAAPVLVPVFRTVDGMAQEINDGDAIPLIEPPQGGQVLLIGGKARNIDGCSLIASVSLQLPDSGEVVAFERRPVTEEATADGWLWPKRPDLLSNFSNLPACPVAGLSRSIDGEPFRLDLQWEDAAGRHAEATLTAVPTCGQPALQDRCACTCAANYVLGSSCP